MKACIIAVGSELLTPFRVDTNSLVLTERLNEIGVELGLKVVVGDRIDDLTAAVAGALGWADVIVVTGGLGPTEDDITREAVARVLGVSLELNESVFERIRRRFKTANLVMPAINRRQALVPSGAVLIENANGTAPGLRIEHGRTTIVLLPGPPREMAPMFDTVIGDVLAAKAGGVALFRRVIMVAGRSESDVDACAQPVYSQWLSQPIPIDTTILASLGHIELHLTARAASRQDAGAALDNAIGELQKALGDSVYSTDGRPLEAVVGDLLRTKGLQLAVAESCSGGVLASSLTDIPGSSDYFERGVVCYSNRSKVEVVGVPQSLLDEHGAVSEPVARALAEGVRARATTDAGIGITGIAGPGGGTVQKPVGTVAISVVCGASEHTRTYTFLGGREQIRIRSAQTALNMLRLILQRSDPERERRF